MDFKIEKHGFYVTVRPEVDKLLSANSSELKTKVIELSHEGFSSMLLDLGQVTFVDSSGLSAILVANRLCNDNNGSFVLVNLNPEVMEMLKISQLDTVLTIMPTKSEGADYLKMEELTRQISNSDDSF